jgi:hypothetical protein
MAEDTPFRFLSDEEFLVLSITDRAIYLSRASQELEMRQKLLREQLGILKKDAGKD